MSNEHIEEAVVEGMEITVSAENEEKWVPQEYEGKLEPNFYCRAWNSKEEKYCTNRAGKGTDHVGAGRCKFHGGATPVKHGYYSKVRRFNSIGGSLGDLYQKYADSEDDPLDIKPELALTRAIIEDWIANYVEFKEALFEWRDAYAEDNDIEPPKLNIPSISSSYKMLAELTKMVDREKKRREANAISLKELFRLMAAMGNTVKNAVKDDSLNESEKIKQINKEWSKLVPKR